MVIQIVNLTGTQLSYLSGSIIVAANGTTTVPITQQIPISTDGQIRADLLSDKIQISDGVDSYSAIDGLNYLHLLSNNGLNIGQAVSAQSMPVVLASDQSSLPIKLEDTLGNAITSQVNGSQRALDVGIDVAGVQVDPRQIRDLAASTDSVAAWVKDSSGNAISAANPLIVEQSISGALVSVTNPIPVSIQEAVPGTTVFNYVDSAAIASGSSVTNVYTVPSSKSFTPYQIMASAPGKIKAVLTWTPDGVTINTLGTFFNSTANPNIIVNFPNTSPLSLSGTAATITITVTNDDVLAQDIYSTIVGLHT